MTIEQAKDYLGKLTSHIMFEYNGKSCGVDPLSRNKFDIWCGDDYATVNSVDKVFGLPFFDGKSLEDIWDDIVDLEF